MTQIATTTSSSLPLTDVLLAANSERGVAANGFTLEVTDEFEGLVQDAVNDVVARQVEAGITLPGDGKYGKAMSNALDFGAWWGYIFQRVGGLTSFTDRRDRQLFPVVYADPASGALQGKQVTDFPTTGPLTYTGHHASVSNIRHLRSALGEDGQGFITAVAPGSAARVWNEHYATHEEHLWAWAEVLKEEYRAITDAGLIVQLDDHSLAENWDQINPEPSIEK